MHVLNTPQRYGTVSIVLHWAMAAVLGVLLASGLYMVSLPDAGFDTRKIELILFHKQLGVAAFAVAAIRLGWRVGGPVPEPVPAAPDWQKVMARFVHLCFYAFMFALPISGWLMSSSAGFPVSIFGRFDLPDLVAPSPPLFRLLVEVHRWLGYALLACVALHTGAALAHHFLYRDDTLRKMLTSRPGGS